MTERKDRIAWGGEELLVALARKTHQTSILAASSFRWADDIG